MPETEIKSVLNKRQRAMIIDRISLLKPSSAAHWGTMTVGQMLKHCRLFEAWIHGIGDWDYSISRSTPSQALEALTAITADNTPIARLASSAEILLVTDPVDNFEAERELWIEHIRGYESYRNDRFVHDFFGKMTAEQVGILAYKHSDHHLRQFGV